MPKPVRKMRAPLWWSNPFQTTRYAVAILSVVAGLLGAELLTAVFHTEPIASCLLCAVIFVAWFSGFGPGLLAIVLSLFAFHYYVSPPFDSFTLKPDLLSPQIAELPRLALFSITSIFVNFLMAAQRRTTESLRGARDTQRERAQLLDLSHDSIFVRGMNGAISFWNRGAEQLYGWSKEETLGQSTHQLLQTIFPSPLEEITSELLSTGRWEGELVHTKRDGTQVTVASRWSLRHDERGRPVGILETNNDITERKRAEYLTRQMFERSPDRMSIVGRDYRYQRVNPAFERRWGMPAKSIVGMHVADLIGMESFDQTRKTYLDQCFAGEEVSYADWFALSHGRRYLAVTHSPLRPTSERVEAALVVIRDLTEHAVALDNLREAQMEIAHVNRVTTMGELTASIAHEVSQPIAAAVTNATAGLRWLAAKPPNLEEIRDAFEDIIKAGYQATEVLSRVRGLIKKIPEQRGVFDINEAILESIALTRSEMLQHGILLKTALANDLTRISGDRIQLQQVMLNLIMNAIEAMSETSEGPRELMILSEIDLPDGVMVTVRDWGPGLKPESLNRLFDPFFSTKPSGLGMGLSICRSITEAHGGRLWATPNIPRGAVFHFTLHQTDSVSLP